MNTTRQNSAIDELNTLLRGEIAAAETYKMAIDTFGDPKQWPCDTLKDLQRDHGRAAQELRSRIEALGGEAADDAGGWGQIARAIQSVADIMGDDKALQALRSGEHDGLTTFEQALRDEKLDDVSAQLVRDDLIPAQQDHLAHLDRLIASVKG
jgi:bacterioferritin (cytochrome b1)